MADYTPLARAAKISFPTLLILVAAVSPLHAIDAPDSIGELQRLLPDSTALEGKIVYVDFWASWCVPCRHSFPWMKELYDKYHPQGLEIVAIGVDKDHKAAMKFLDDIKPAFPVVFDSTGDIARQYGLETMPSSFIYGRDGRLRIKNRGFRPGETDSLDAVIGKMLNEGKSQ